MRLNSRSKNLTPPEKDQYEKYLEEKVKRLQKLIEPHYWDEDTVKLDARMQKHDKHKAFEFEFVLELPRNGNMVAREVKHSVTEVMDLATDALETQLKKHFKKIARE